MLSPVIIFDYIVGERENQYVAFYILKTRSKISKIDKLKTSEVITILAHKEELALNIEEKIKPLLTALKAEKEAQNFYGRMANRSTNPTGQQMFKHLMNEEKKHMKVLEKRLKKLGGSADTSGLTEKASVLSEIDFADPSLSDLEIINVAIEDEKHAIDFYTKAANASDSAEEKEMYNLLANDEKNHMQSLEREAKRLKNA